MSTAAVAAISLIVAVASAVITIVTLATLQEPDAANANPDAEVAEFPAYTEGRPIPVVYGLVMLNGTIAWKADWPTELVVEVGSEEKQSVISSKVLLILCHGKINFLNQWNSSLGDWTRDIDGRKLMATAGVDNAVWGGLKDYVFFTDVVGDHYDLFVYRFGNIIPDDGTKGFYPAIASFNHIEGGNALTYRPDWDRFDFYGAVNPENTFESDLENQSALPNVAKIYIRDIISRNGAFPRFKIPVARNDDFRTKYPELDFYPMWDFGLPPDLGIRGCAPATIIYDILVDTQYGLQIDSSNIDIASFNAANAYYQTLRWGLSMKIENDREARSIIEDVELLVGCKLRLNDEGKYTLKHFTPDDEPAATIYDDDIIEFKLVRQTWDDTFNDLRAKAYDRRMQSAAWVLEELYFNPTNFVTRMISVKNPANIALTGNVRIKEYDLRAFGSLDIASSRLYELLKIESTPRAKGSIKSNLKYSYLNEGDIIRYVSDEYGTTLNFRILTKTINEKEENELEFGLVEEIFYINSQYTKAGEGEAEDTDSPTEFQFVKIFELPFVKSTFPYLKHTNPLPLGNQTLPQTYAILIPRTKDESIVSASIFISPDDSNYTFEKSITTFAPYGTLQEEYPADTYSIDDDVGVLFQHHASTQDRTYFENLSRAGLFNNRRLALIDDELITFQTVTDEGGGNFRLEGVIRGLLWTERALHANGSGIWFFGEEAGTRDIFIEPAIENFYIKPVPIAFKNKTLDLSSITGIYEATDNKSATPQAPRLKATRSGSTVTIEWFPVSYVFFSGAGYMPEDSYTDEFPLAYTGSFLIYKVGEPEVGTTAQSTVVTDASDFTYKVKHNLSGFLSDEASVYVGVNDGTYYGD